MRTVGLVIPLALLACRRAPEPPGTAAPSEQELLQVAREHLRYGRVDDETRWAPLLCRTPDPGRARWSEGRFDVAHGRKLYSLFARDRDAYLRGGRQPAGQAIVKEAWVPEPVPGMSPAEIRSGGSFSPYAVRDGTVYHAARPAGLFIMLKTGAGPDSDDGWIYATTSADGRTLTSSGRLASCMSCHRDAPSDRLFGLRRP